MIDIIKLLESQGYRHGGPIHYFEEGGSSEGRSAREGGNFGGTGSNTPGPSGPDGGSRDSGRDSTIVSSNSESPREGGNFGGTGSNTPSVSSDPGSSTRSGDDGSADASAPASITSITSAPTSYASFKPGEDAFAQYGATTATNIHNQAEQAKAEGATLASILGREPNYGELSQLSDSGMGSMEGVNPNNLTGQTVDQMLATQNLANTVDKYAIPALSALVPNFAIAYNLAKVASGDITVGDALTSFATSYAAKALNVSPSVLSSMIAGNFGQAASSYALGSVTKGIAKAANIPGALAAFGVKESGAGQAISNAINGTIGNTGMGVSPATIASSINKAVSSIGGAITGSPTTAGTTGTGAQPLSLDPVDNILNDSSNAPTMSDIVPSAAPAESTTPARAPVAATPSSSSFAIPVNTAANTTDSGADIGYLYDVGGSDIFAPRKAGAPKPDVLKYLQDSTASAAQGGSITDLLDYVRK